MTAPETVGAPAQAQHTTTTSPKGASMTSIQLDEFTIHGADRALYFRTNADLLMGRGDDVGAVLVRHQVDLDAADLVEVDTVQTDPLYLLNRTIEVLTAARDEMAAMVPADRRTESRCVEIGDWGRCELTAGHDGGHALPTEDDWTAERIALGKPVPGRP